MNLRSKALLVRVSTKMWTGVRKDASVSRAVDRLHNTANAGSYRKNLIDPSAIKPIGKVRNSINMLKYQLTLPWTDGGDRLLPSALYLQFTREYGELRDEFNALVDEFVVAYPDHRLAAEKALNGLYNAFDYPFDSEIRGKFSTSAHFSQIPDVSDDIRIDNVPDSHLDAIKSSGEEMMQDKHQLATASITDRAAKLVKHLITTLEDAPESNWKSSLITNIQDLADLLPDLNYTGSAKIAKLSNELRSLDAPVELIKTNEVARQEVIDRAKALDQLFF